MSSYERTDVLDHNYIPKMTVFLIAVNVIVWIVLEWMGNTESAEFMMKHGALTVDQVRGGNWYVLFTSMFLHFGYIHLFQNMFVLFFASRYLEQEIGSLYYLLLYLLSGIVGNVCSYYVSLAGNDVLSVSAGASGAVFGVLGALVVLTLLKQGRLAWLGSRGMVIMVVLCVIQGFSTAGVNNVAHMSGMACGVVMGLVYRFLNVFDSQNLRNQS